MTAASSNHQLRTGKIILRSWQRRSGAAALSLMANQYDKSLRLFMGQRQQYCRNKQHHRTLWTTSTAANNTIPFVTTNREDSSSTGTSRQYCNLRRPVDPSASLPFAASLKQTDQWRSTQLFHAVNQQRRFLSSTSNSSGSTTTTTSKANSSTLTGDEQRQIRQDDADASSNDAATTKETKTTADASTPTNDDDGATWRDRMASRRDAFSENMSGHTERGRDAAKKGAKNFREMVRQYGPVFVWTYGGVYISTLGIFFLGIDSGLVDPAYIVNYVSPPVEGDPIKSSVEVVVEVMDHYAWTRPWVPFFERNPGLANFGIAWIAVKFTEPIRFGFTVAIVPRLARYFGYVKTDDAAADETDKPTTKESTETSSTETKSS